MNSIPGRLLRIPGALERDVTAPVLHRLLTGLLLWTVFYAAIILGFATPTPFGSGVALAAQVAAFATALLYLRRGRVRLASLIYLSGLWLTATAVIFLNGGIRSPGLAWYVSIPISAAWLLGFRAAALALSVCMATSLGIAVQGASSFSGAPLDSWAVLLEATIAASIPVMVVLRRQTEALRRQDEVISRIMETSPIGILACDSEGRIEFANENAENILGLTRDELRQRKPCEDVLLFRAIRSTLKPARDVRCLVEDREGARTVVSVNAAPLLTAAGEFEGVVAAIENITERQRNHERLMAAQKTESMVALIAGIAHKFNNDIGTILSEADLALSDLPPESDAAANIERLCAAAIRLSKTVSLLRIYDAGYLSVNPTIIDISQTVKESVSLFEAAIPRKAILRLSLAPDLPRILADASEIRQVVVSLLTNAWESLPNGEGSISVATSRAISRARSNKNRAAGLAGGDYVRLEVTDTGCGIPPENLPKIFDPFYTTKSLGRGLGLAGMQGTVRRAGGVIQAHSTPGKGSTFEIIFPAAEYPLREPTELNSK